MCTRWALKSLGVSVWLLTVWCGAPAWALTDPEAYQLYVIARSNSKLLANLEKNFPGFMRQAKRGAPQTLQHTATATPAVAVPKVASAAPSTAEKVAPPATANNNISKCPGWHFLLRNDWSDIGYLGCPTPVDKATGASLSFTQNYVANNRNWAAQGVAGIVYSDITQYTAGLSGGLFDRSVAAYIQTNTSFNSNATLASKNMETNTVGMSGELGFVDTSGDNINIFRLTPNVVQDAIKRTTSAAVMGESIPADGPFWDNIGYFGGNINAQLDPILKLQYADSTSATPLLFSGKSQSFRVGPEFTLLAQPYTGGTDDFLDRLGLKITWHGWYDTYAAATNYWWSNSVTYRLDANGNFAASFSYSRGLDENSGVFTNQYMLSLNGKI